MNTLALTANPSSDYRIAMQQAAVAYLYRHRCEHLAGDTQLLDNCARYLALSLEVPQFLVQRIAELAVVEFESMTCNRIASLGIDHASSSDKQVIWLLDTSTQQRHSVPARVLPTRLLCTRNTLSQ
jgi:hypothetical protein